MILKIFLSTVAGGVLATVLSCLVNVWAVMDRAPTWYSVGGNLLQAFLLSLLFQRWLDAWGFLRGAFHAAWIAGLFAGAFNLRYVSGAQVNLIYLTLFDTLIWVITGGIMGLLLQKMRGRPVFRW
jgi:hypothetical protein